MFVFYVMGIIFCELYILLFFCRANLHKNFMFIVNIAKKIYYQAKRLKPCTLSAGGFQLLKKY